MFNQVIDLKRIKKKNKIICCDSDHPTHSSSTTPGENKDDSSKAGYTHSGKEEFTSQEGKSTVTSLHVSITQAHHYVVKCNLT